MTEKRSEPSFVADERTMLAGWLDYHRATLAWKCDGLDDAQLRRRAVEPSSLSLLGLVRHMAEVERGWFQYTAAGDKSAIPLYYSEADPDGDFDNVDDADVAEAFAKWHEQCEVSRKIAAGIESLDVTATNRRGELMSLRWIMTHMIEEYARHNGHADFLRERIDGATGE
jgi:uncharacterized damage-inducible protein DinB